MEFISGRWTRINNAAINFVLDKTTTKLDFLTPSIITRLLVSLVCNNITINCSGVKVRADVRLEN